MPMVTHELDTQNFEEFEEKEPASATAGTRRRLQADPNFIGYTYKNWEAISPREGGFELRLPHRMPASLTMHYQWRLRADPDFIVTFIRTNRPSAREDVRDWVSPTMPLHLGRVSVLLPRCLCPFRAHALLPAWEQVTLLAFGNRLTLSAMSDHESICISRHDDIIEGRTFLIITSLPADEECEGIMKLKPKAVSRPKLSDLQGAFADAAT